MSYALPDHWAMATVGDIAEVSGGLTKNAAKRDVSRHRAPLVSVAAVQLRSIDESAIGEVGLLDSDGERASLSQGDLLIVEGNGSLDHIGRVALWNVQVPGARHQNHIIRVRSREVSSAFLLEWLSSPRGRDAIIEQATSATGLYTLSLSKVERLPVPVPPLNEQRRIVAKLDAIFEQTRAAKTRLERLPALLDKLKRSILAAAFRGDLTADWRAAHLNVEPAGALLDRIRAERRARWEAAIRAKGRDPSKVKYEEPPALDGTELPDIPPTWTWSPAGTLLERIEAGRSPKAHGRPANADEFGVLKVSAVSWGKFLPLENKALVAGDIAEAELLVRRGDLLITRANTVELVGAVVLVEGDYPNLMLSDKTLRLVPAESIVPEFLLYALRTSQVRRVFEEDATGTSDSMRNITQGKIRAAPIAVAPAAEQREIARRLVDAFSVVDALRERIERADIRVNDVERSTLAKAFRGELVQQDPADEPAATLLSRVRVEPSVVAPTRARQRRKRVAVEGGKVSDGV